MGTLGETVGGAGAMVAMLTYLPEILSENLRLIYPVLCLVCLVLAKVFLYVSTIYISSWLFYFWLALVLVLFVVCSVHQLFLPSLRYLLLKEKF